MCVQGLLPSCLGPVGPCCKLIFHHIALPKVAKQEEEGGNFLFAIESSGRLLAGKIWKGARNRLRDLKAVFSCSSSFCLKESVLSFLTSNPCHRKIIGMLLLAKFLLGIRWPC